MSENPGGWPTCPLESSSLHDRREAANSLADLRRALFDALTPPVAWLARKMDRSTT